MKQPVLYVKSVTLAGVTKFYVGDQPSNPDAHICHRLGRYFIICESQSAAESIARAHAERVEVCETLVGL